MPPYLLTFHTAKHESANNATRTVVIRQYESALSHWQDAQIRANGCNASVYMNRNRLFVESVDK